MKSFICLSMKRQQIKKRCCYSGTENKRVQQNDFVLLHPLIFIVAVTVSRKMLESCLTAIALLYLCTVIRLKLQCGKYCCEYDRNSDDEACDYSERRSGLSDTY